MTLVPLKFSQKDLGTYFSAGVIVKGLAYKKQNRVFKLEIAPDGMSFSSAVRGSYESSYKVKLSLSYLNNKVTFKGDCTCPVGHKCKHMAATLLQLLEVSKKVPENNMFVQDLDVIEGTIEEKRENNLDYSLNNWFEAFSNPGAQTQEEKKNVIVYIISLPRYNEAFRLKAYRTTILKAGTYSSSEKRISLQNLKHNPPQEASEVDLAILGLMDANSSAYYGDTEISISQSLAHFFLDLLLKSKRCYFQRAYHPSLCLKQGEQKNSGIIWKSDPQGNQVPVAVIKDDPTPCVLKTLPLSYVCPNEHTIGPLKFKVTDEQALALLGVPPQGLRTKIK